jgi:hypothetical protein
MNSESHIRKKRPEDANTNQLPQELNERFHVRKKRPQDANTKQLLQELDERFNKHLLIRDE